MNPDALKPATPTAPAPLQPRKLTIIIETSSNLGDLRLSKSVLFNNLASQSQYDAVLDTLEELDGNMLRALAAIPAHVEQPETNP